MNSKRLAKAGLLAGTTLLAFSLAACDRTATTSSVDDQQIEQAEKNQKAEEAQASKKAAEDARLAAEAKHAKDVFGIFELDLPDGFTKVPLEKFNAIKDTGEITLFAQNDEKKLTFYISKLGRLKTNAKDFFERLTSILKDMEKGDYKELKIAEPTEDSMKYRFSHQDAKNTIRESCEAIVLDNEVYCLCTIGLVDSFDELDSIIDSVSRTKK